MSELVSRSREHEVSISVGYTANMGNFESLRVDVGLTTKGLPGESADEVFSKVKEWVEKKFIQEFREISEQTKKVK